MKPTFVHGITRACTSDTGTRRSVTFSRRRSQSRANPRKRHKPSTWTDSITGYVHVDSRMPTLAGVSCSHRKKLNKDIRREASRWDNGSVEPSAFVINRMAVSQAVKVHARQKTGRGGFSIHPAANTASRFNSAALGGTLHPP